MQKKQKSLNFPLGSAALLCKELSTLNFFVPLTSSKVLSFEKTQNIFGFLLP